MITGGILHLFFDFVRWLISLFPSSASNTIELNGLTSFMGVLSKGFIIFPISLWLKAIASIAGWKVIQFAWVVIEWIYKKIPGVD